MNNKYFKGLGANILLLGVVSFLNDVSSEMILPILPMFIKSLGGAGLAVGLAGGLRDSIPSILNILCGYWSDRIGKRKLFVSTGYLTSAVLKLLLAFSKTWQQAVIFIGLERIGKALRTAARDAIIAESVITRRGKSFGIHRAFDSAGAIFGSIVVFVLFWVFGLSFERVILIAGVVAFASLVPIYFVKEVQKHPKEFMQKISLRELTRPLQLFIVVAGIFALANFSYMFFILKAQEAFSDKLSVAMPILLYILFNIFYAGFAIPFGGLSDKIGKGKVIILGYLLFSLSSFGFAYFRSLPAFVILFILYGIAYAAIEGNQRAFVSDLASGQLKATALGAFHTTIGLMAFPASLIAGFLWQHFGSSITFIYGGTVGVLSIVLFLVFGSYLGTTKAN
jgi:MFS family permease